MLIWVQLFRGCKYVLTLDLSYECLIPHIFLQNRFHPKARCTRSVIEKHGVPYFEGY